MMGVAEIIKSVTSTFTSHFVPTVFWQRDIKTEQGVGISVQARKSQESKMIGLRIVMPAIDSNYTALLSVDEAQKVSKYLNDAIAEFETSAAKQGAEL